MRNDFFPHFSLVRFYSRPDTEYNKADKQIKYLKDTIQHFMWTDTEQTMNMQHRCRISMLQPALITSQVGTNSRKFEDVLKKKVCSIRRKARQNCQGHHPYFLYCTGKTCLLAGRGHCLKHPLLFFSAKYCRDFSLSHSSPLYFSSKINFLYYNRLINNHGSYYKNLHVCETILPSFRQWLLSSCEPIAVFLYHLLPNTNIKFIVFSRRIIYISVLLNYAYLESDFYLQTLFSM